LGGEVDAQFNGGAVRLIGAEAVAGTRWLLPQQMSLPIDLSGTLTRGQFLTSFDSGFPQFGAVEAGDLLPYVPAAQGAAVVALEHPRFRVGLEATARSGMRDVAESADEEPLVPALALLGASGHATLGPGWEAYITGSNLTARSTVVSWRPFGARPTAPLQVMVGLKWSAPAP
jgi:Fe(3+) dicitrate transport protein